jgi:hypothetical protein
MFVRSMLQLSGVRRRVLHFGITVALVDLHRAVDRGRMQPAAERRHAV